MRASQVLAPTLRDDPASAEVVSHRLLLRAGLIRQLGSGLFNWLPLGLRVIQRIEQIIRDELNKTGAQEILMPVVQPSELWQESGRWETMGAELLRMSDRHDRDYCFSPTHEEVVTDVLRQTVTSYRDLPLSVYQINTKFRDEIRPRFGLMRSREFIMKDGYSFHLSEESLDQTYQAVRSAYSRILERIGLRYRSVEADSGLMGGSDSEEFHVLADSGEDLIAFSPNSAYAANVERAEAVCQDSRPAPTQSMVEVETPNQRTIQQVSEHLSIPVEKCVKTLLVHGSDSLLALVLRGDHQLNELKAAHLEGIESPLRFASDDTIKQVLNVEPGSIGPVALSIPCIVDRSATVMADFVCGANRDGFHLVGVNWERDVALNRVEDIRLVEEGDQAPDGSGELAFARGIEVGHIFKLGRKYSESMNATVQAQSGEEIHPTMGCYGFGVSRMVAAIVEQCYDDSGINWPESVAPAHVHIVSLNQQRSERVRTQAQAIYEDCIALGIDAYWDDRDERPGVKFNDADLLGIPHRIVIGDRGLERDILEYKFQKGDTEELSVSDTRERIGLN